MPDAPQTVVKPERKRIRTEKLEVIADPEAQKLELVVERIRLQKKQFLSELRSRLGLILITCEATGISYDTVRAWAKSDPQFFQDMHSVSEYTIDVVEQGLLNKIVKDQDTTAMIFYLKTKGRNRGFGQKVEVTGPDGGALQSETTLKISELQKEMPADVLDLIIGKVHGNMQPVANAVMDVIKEEEFSDEVLEAAMGSTPYEIDEPDEELELE